MRQQELKRIREKLGLSREEFAETFGLSGYNAVSNIELGYRRPSKLTIILLRVLDSLPLTRAEDFLEQMRRYGNEK